MVFIWFVCKKSIKIINLQIYQCTELPGHVKKANCERREPSLETKGKKNRSLATNNIWVLYLRCKYASVLSLCHLDTFFTDSCINLAVFLLSKFHSFKLGFSWWFNREKYVIKGKDLWVSYHPYYWGAMISQPGKIIFVFLKTPFVPLIVLKTTASIPRSQCKNRFEKRTTVGWDICKNVFKHWMPNQTVTLFCFYSIISAQGGSFFKPIFALNLWD